MKDLGAQEVALIEINVTTMWEISEAAALDIKTGGPVGFYPFQASYRWLICHPSDQTRLDHAGLVSSAT